MIKIRLQRRGRHKRPIHHIVVADSRSPRDGRIIEDLGRFDNITLKNEVDLDEERAIYWLKEGAQPSDTVRSILKNKGIMYKMHLMRWGKSEEEIEAALAKWHEAREEKAEKEPSAKEKQEAILEAEEKEYQKQLKKKAEEAAKEKARLEAIEAKEKAEAEERAEEDVEAETEVETETVEETEPAEQEPAESEEEPQAESDEAAAKQESKAEASEEPAKEEATEEKAQSEEEIKDEEEQEAAEAEQTSDDMLAKEAITHIKETPLDQLAGFVTDDEDRVTVQRAWEEKKEEE